MEQKTQSLSYVDPIVLASQIRDVEEGYSAFMHDAENEADASNIIKAMRELHRLEIQFTLSLIESDNETDAEPEMTADYLGRLDSDQASSPEIQEIMSKMKRVSSDILSMLQGD